MENFVPTCKYKRLEGIRCTQLSSTNLQSYAKNEFADCISISSLSVNPLERSRAPKDYEIANLRHVYNLSL